LGTLYSARLSNGDFFVFPYAYGLAYAFISRADNFVTRRFTYFQLALDYVDASLLIDGNPFRLEWISEKQSCTENHQNKREREARLHSSILACARRAHA
jgi:hypothetical protein